MKFYEISFYRNRNWIDKKYVKSELGSSDAIAKTRLKKIVDVQEISEEEYLAGVNRSKEAAQKRKDRKQELGLL